MAGLSSNHFSFLLLSRIIISRQPHQFHEKGVLLNWSIWIFILDAILQESILLLESNWNFHNIHWCKLCSKLPTDINHLNFFGWIPNVISRALDSIWNGSKSHEQSPTQWIKQNRLCSQSWRVSVCIFLTLYHFFLLFVSFNEAVKLYVISVNLLNLTSETTWSKIDLDHQLFLSIAADNVKELPLTLKYTVYILLWLYESMTDKRFHTFSRKKKKILRRRVVKSCRSIFCLPLQ